MDGKRLRIGVVAPASRMSPDTADKVVALSQRLYGDRAPQIVCPPPGLASSGHFAGDDVTRAAVTPGSCRASSGTCPGLQPSMQPGSTGPRMT